MVSDIDSVNGEILEVSSELEGTMHGSNINMLKPSSALNLPFGHASVQVAQHSTQNIHGETANTKTSKYDTRRVTISDDAGPSSVLKETQGTGASGDNTDARSHGGHHATIKEEPIFAEDEHVVIDEAGVGLDAKSEND